MYNVEKSKVLSSDSDAFSFSVVHSCFNFSSSTYFPRIVLFQAWAYFVYRWSEYFPILWKCGWKTKWLKCQVHAKTRNFLLPFFCSVVATSCRRIYRCIAFVPLELFICNTRYVMVINHSFKIKSVSSIDKIQFFICCCLFFSLNFNYTSAYCAINCTDRIRY